MTPLSTLLFALAAAAAAPSEAGTGDAWAGSRTAVVITLEDRELPGIEAMQGWFMAGESPLEVVAVERGPAEVVVVRDPAVQHHLDLLAKGFLDQALGEVLAPVDPAARRVKEWDPQLLADGAGALLMDGQHYFRTAMGRPQPADLEAIRLQLQQACRLGEDVWLRFVSAVAAPVSRTVEPTNLFKLTHRLPTRDRGFLTVVETAPLEFTYRSSDAVALVGRELHAIGRRRAVVVLAESRSPDESLYPAVRVAELLEDLQVPVFAWSFGRGSFAAHWSGERRITDHPGLLDATLDLARFEAACDEVRATLEAQRVVWLEGRHPLPLVRLSEAAEGVRLAGEVPELAEAPPEVQAVLLERRKKDR